MVIILSFLVTGVIPLNLLSINMNVVKAANEITYSAKNFADEVLLQMGDISQYYPISSINSPWNSATFINTWDKQNHAYGPFYESYIMNSTAVYSDFGISVFLSKSNPGLFWFNPGATVDSWLGKHNVALIFNSPQDGTYTFSADDINNVLAKNFTNKTMAGVNSTVNAGVRIMLDDQKIWPAENDWMIITPGSSVPIPLISNIIVKKGQELRIETKACDKTTANYQVQVTASAKMIYTGPIPNDVTPPIFGAGSIECTTPEMFSLPISFPTANDNYTAKNGIIYHLYLSDKAFGNDFPNGNPAKTLSALTANKAEIILTQLTSQKNYYIAIVAKDINGNRTSIKAGPFQTTKMTDGTTFPGSEFSNEILSRLGSTPDTYAINSDNSVWNTATFINSWDKQNQAYGPFYDAYILNSTAVYADSGISVFLSKTVSGLFWLNPGSTFDSWIQKHNVALSFTAPQDGMYNFSPDDINNTLARNFTNKTISGMDSTVNASIRIMLDNQKIWPFSSDWQLIAPGASIPIPNISNIIMKSGQELRIEAKANEKTSGNYQVQITASAKMTYTGPIPEDIKAPVFGDGRIECSTPGMFSLPIKFPTATDDFTLKGGISYYVYIANTAFGNQLPSGSPVKTISSQTADKVAVELTKLSPGIDYYISVVAMDIKGNKSFIKAGPIKTLKLADGTSFCSKIFANEILTQMGDTVNTYSVISTNSPWNTETFITSWDKQNQAYGPFYDAFILNSTAVFADAGISVFLSKTIPGLYWLNPGATFDGWIGKHNAALSFTAPQDGEYTFSADDIDDILAKNFTNKTITGVASVVNAGVRIMIDDQKIWPSNAEWQILAPGKSVPIPTLAKLRIRKNQKLRIEVKADKGISENYKLQVTASAKITYLRAADVSLPVFADENILTENITEDSMKIIWPKATDNLTKESKIKYNIYYGTSPILNIPTNKEGIVVTGSTSLQISNLKLGTGYYVMVVANDESSNKQGLFAGPFKTKGTAKDNMPEKIENVVFPNEPLIPTVSESESGIISSTGDSAILGWIPKTGLSEQRVYAFIENDNGSYSLEIHSAALDISATQYEVNGLTKGENYILQVVSYNIMGDPIVIYPRIPFKTDDDATSSSSSSSANSNSSETNSGVDNKGDTDKNPGGNIPTNNGFNLKSILYALAIIIMSFVTGLLIAFVIPKIKNKRAVINKKNSKIKLEE